MILGRSVWSLSISISCIQWWRWNCLIFYPKCSHRWNWYDCSKGASKNSSNTMISLNIKPWFRSNKTHCYKPAHAHKTKTNLSSSPNYLYPSYFLHILFSPYSYFHTHTQHRILHIASHLFPQHKLSPTHFPTHSAHWSYTAVSYYCHCLYIHLLVDTGTVDWW